MEMELVGEEIIVKTPKRLKREERGAKTPTTATNTPTTGSKKSKLKAKALINGEEGEGGAEALTPRIRALSSASASPIGLERSVNNMEFTDNEDESDELEDEDFEEEDEQDEDYEQQSKRKSVVAGRKKRVAKRKLKDQWTVTQEFADDVSTEDYIETTSWFKDKELDSEEGLKTFYFCGEASGKSCPAKAYSFRGADAKVAFYVNEKEHVHQSGKRGMPEVVKREIRRIINENQVKEVNDILAKLAEKNMLLPTKPQIRNFISLKTKKPKVRLPNLLKAKNDRADSSDVEKVGKKRKRSRSVHRNSSPEQ